MNTNKLITDVNSLKLKLEQVEASTNEQMLKFESYEKGWKLNYDKEAELLNKMGNSIVKFNVSGEKFQTRLKTILSMRDTLLYNLVLDTNFDISKEVYLDRSPQIFKILMDYMRYKDITYSSYPSKVLYNLLLEADYFEVGYFNKF